EHVHLLPDVGRQLPALEAIEDLQYARIHTLCTVSGERALRNNVRLDALEVQGRLQLPVAAYEGHCRRLATNAPGIVLVHIDAHMQPVQVAEQDERRLQDAC